MTSAKCVGITSYIIPTPTLIFNQHIFLIFVCAMTSYIYAKLYSTWGDSNLEYIFTLQSSATKRLYMLINNCWSLYVVLINYFKLCCYYKLFHYTMQMYTCKKNQGYAFIHNCLTCGNFAMIRVRSSDLFLACALLLKFADNRIST